MKKIALCPGSFDPITNGHLDVIERAALLFDEVVVLIMINPSKTSIHFSIEDRVRMARCVTEHIPNVQVQQYEGLLVDYAKQCNACAVVKGLRAISDFEYEFQMSLTNKKLYPQLETLFLTTSLEYMYLSSSIVRQVAALGGDISEFVSPKIKDEVFHHFLQT